MSKFIFLDTNNWIYLSNGYNIYSNKHDELHLKVFEKVKSWSEEGRVTFLINDIVLNEWDRNKDQATKNIKTIEKKYKSHIDNLESIKSFIGYIPEEIVKLKEILKAEYLRKVNRYTEHIQSVENFLKKQTVKIEISENNKIDATNLALEKKAPFIGDKKNSMADAIILLSSIEYIYQKRHQPKLSGISENIEYTYPESFFVSSNKGDFSSQENREIIHPDLEPFLNKTNTKFFYALNKLVNSLEEKFLTEEEEKILEDLDASLYCEICNYNHYPTVEFSQFIEVYDPHKKPTKTNQLTLNSPEFDDKFFEELSFFDYVESEMSQIRTAECNYCGAEYLKCTCGELVHIDKYNTKIVCDGCDNKFIVHADIDKKGMVHTLDYEMVEDFICVKCGDEFDSLDENGFCEECSEYERISNEK